MEKKNLRRPLPIALIALGLALLLLAVNVAFALLPQHSTLLDVTAKKQYSISRESQKYLKSLRDDVTIYLLNVDDADPGFQLLIERYEQYGKHVTVSVANAEKSAALLGEYGYGGVELSPYSVLVVGPYRATVLDYMQMFLYRSSAGYSDMSASEYVYALQSISAYSGTSQYESLVQQISSYSLYYDGEKLITAAIEYTTLEHIPHAYLLQGHGEADATAGNFATVLSMVGMKRATLELNEDTVIPTDASCLVINAPTSDYSEKEAQIVLDYLKQGGNLLLLTTEENHSMPNLMAIAAYYGAEAKEGVVTLPATEEETKNGEVTEGSEENTEAEPSEDAQAQEESAEESAEKSAEESAEETEEVDLTLLTPSVNFQHEVFASATGLTASLSGMNALQIDASLRPGLLVTPLLYSPEEALLGEDAAAHVLAVAMEEPAGDQTSRIVWFTGAENFNSSTAQTQNIYLPLYGIHWTFENYTSQIGNISAISYTADHLSTTEMSSAWLSVLFIGMIPLSLAGAGILVYMKRKKA